METEGRKNEHGGQEPGTENNVVPFPRDWLGPREELIPFGTSAGHRSDEGAGPGAEAFWGGDSGPLQAVLPALPGGEPSPIVATPRLRGRAGRLAAAGLAAALLAAAVFGRLAGIPTAGSGPAVGSDVAAAGFFDLAQLRGAVGVPDIESPKPSVHKPVRRRPHAAARVKRPARSRTGSSSSTVAAAQSSVSRSTNAESASTTSSSSASGSSGSTPVSTASSEPAATSTAPRHSSVSSHTASHAGPVGPGAPFGPGQLN